MLADALKAQASLRVVVSCCFAVAAFVAALAVWAVYADPEAVAKPAAVLVAGYSNIERRDYVGPAACGECHPENHALWQAHPHSRMNAAAGPETVKGDFSGIELAYDGFSDGPNRSVPAGRARFTHEGDAFLVETTSGAVRRRYRVTRTVGSRTVQMYVGRQVEGPEPVGDTVYDVELRLPFGYLLPRKQWYSTPYFDHGYVMESKDAPISATVTPGLDLWESNCATCHNTYAYVQRLQVATTYHAGFRREHFRGALATAPTGLSLGAEDLVTVGISCESCHLGGREHAVDGKPIHFVPTHDELRHARPDLLPKDADERESAYVVNAVCRQCHGRPVETYPNGSVKANSAEGYDMRASCAGKLKCTDCHNPHRAGPAASGGPDNPEHVAACAGCHQEHASPEGQVAHSHHPAAAGVSCLDCHMPRTITGLQTVTRTHRVSSPTDLATYAAGTPNACNLCHLDRTQLWALDSLAAAWKLGEVLPSTTSRVRGDVAAGPLWLTGSDRDVRMVAADAYSRLPAPREHLPELVAALADPYPYARLLIRVSVERALGRTLPHDAYDITAPAEVRERQLRAVLEAP